MCRFTTIFLSVLLFYGQACFILSADDLVIEKKEPLYSTNKNRQIGEVSLSIEVKSLESNPKEFYLVVGEKNNDNIIDGGKANRSIWLFNKKMAFNDLKKEAKNQDINLDAKGYRDVEPFSGTGIKFDMRSWNELRRQTKYAFSVDAPVGREVILKLHFYVATVEKKTTTIDDDALVTFTFTVPQPGSTTATRPRTASSTSGQSQGQQAQSSNASPQNEQGVVNLSETISALQQAMKPDEAAEEERQKQLQAQAEAQAATQAEELKSRTEDLNVFITIKNKEMASLLLDLEELNTSKRKIQAKELDSIELILSEMRKKVEYWDKGYTDILLKEEAIQDKFTKFSSDQTIASKQLAEMRGKVTSPKDLLMKIGIIAGVAMMFVMLLMQILRPFLSKKKMAKLQEKQMKMMQGQSQIKGVGGSATNIQSTISKI